ncbi:MAG TPA: manganese efflux pump [Bacillaceae bacterium]|nr:manganese efflux pump [Bacillaceae bacterium]
MAFAVGMDAFSISLGLGIYRIRLRRIFYIGLVVGVFHVVMPTLGILTGHFLSGLFGQITTYIGGILLILLGIQMIYFCFREEENNAILPVGWGIIFFSLLVSLDSFSAGLSLGMFGVRTAAAVICFGIIATCLTWSGFLIGRKVHNLLGTYAEVFGGVVLAAFGFQLLFPISF